MLCPDDKRVESDMTDVVYIMGHGYSGSTLLTFLLGAHPEIATIGELGIAEHTKRQVPP